MYVALPAVYLLLLLVNPRTSLNACVSWQVTDKPTVRETLFTLNLGAAHHADWTEEHHSSGVEEAYGEDTTVDIVCPSINLVAVPVTDLCRRFIATNIIWLLHFTLRFRSYFAYQL